MINPLKSLPRPLSIAVGILCSSAIILAVFSVMFPTSPCNYILNKTFGIWWFPSLYVAQALGVFVISTFRRSGRTIGGIVIAALVLATTIGLLFEYDTTESWGEYCCGNPPIKNGVTF